MKIKKFEEFINETSNLMWVSDKKDKTWVDDTDDFTNISPEDYDSHIYMPKEQLDEIIEKNNYILSHIKYINQGSTWCFGGGNVRRIDVIGEFCVQISKILNKWNNNKTFIGDDQIEEGDEDNHKYIPKIIMDKLIQKNIEVSKDVEEMKEIKYSKGYLKYTPIYTKIDIIEKDSKIISILLNKIK